MIFENLSRVWLIFNHEFTHYNTLKQNKTLGGNCAAGEIHIYLYNRSCEEESVSGSEPSGVHALIFISKSEMCMCMTVFINERKFFLKGWYNI